MTTPEQRLIELGIELPELRTPAGAYVPAVRTGNLVRYLRRRKLRPSSPATLASEPVEAPTKCRCAARSFARAYRTRTAPCSRSSVNVTSSETLAEGGEALPFALSSDAGKHARSAVGQAELPFDISVEIEMVVEVSA